MSEYDEYVAGHYDDVYSTPLARAENEVVQRHLAPLAADARVLDLGAGTGLVAELTDPAFYCAVDQSSEMLDKLRTKVEAFTICADLTTEDGIAQFRDSAATVGPFDLVTSLWAIHDFPSLSLFRACHQLLVPGGTIWLHGNWLRRGTRPAGANGRVDFDPTFTPDAGIAFAEYAFFVDVRAIGTNAAPDSFVSRVHEDSMPFIIWASQLRRPKHHYHGAITGRKFYGI